MRLQTWLRKRVTSRRHEVETPILPQGDNTIAGLVKENSTSSTLAVRHIKLSTQTAHRCQRVYCAGEKITLERTQSNENGTHVVDLCWAVSRFDDKGTRETNPVCPTPRSISGTYEMVTTPRVGGRSDDRIRFRRRQRVQCVRSVGTIKGFKEVRQGRIVPLDHVALQFGHRGDKVGLSQRRRKLDLSLVCLR